MEGEGAFSWSSQTHVRGLSLGFKVGVRIRLRSGVGVKVRGLVGMVRVRV